MQISSRTNAARAAIAATLIATVISTNELLAAVSSGAEGQAGLVRFAPATNAGSVLGFAQGAAIWLPVAMAGVCTSILVMRRTGASVVGGGLIAGGAAANTLQRITLHGVTDYVQVGTTRAGLAFNAADIALLAGTVLTTRSLLPVHDRLTTGRR